MIESDRRTEMNERGRRTKLKGTVRSTEMPERGRRTEMTKTEERLR